MLVEFSGGNAAVLTSCCLAASCGSAGIGFDDAAWETVGEAAFDATVGGIAFLGG